MSLPVFKRYAWRVMLRRLRAFRTLKRRGITACQSSDVIRRLSFVELHLPAGVSFGLVPRAFNENLELVIRQRILSCVTHTHLLPAAMCAQVHDDKSHAIPLPAQWRRWLDVEGVRVNAFSSWVEGQRLKWYFLKRGFRRTLQLLLKRRHRGAAPETGYAALVDLSPGTVLDGADCFANWYAQSSLRKDNEKVIWCHGSGVTPGRINDELFAVNYAMPRMNGLAANLGFAADCLKIVSVCVVKTLLGSWWAPTLFEDAIQLAYVRRLKSEQIASTYVFNNSSWIFRPLWTYFAEQIGTRVLMAFYSTNIEPYTFSDGTTTPVAVGYETMNWPEYAVWDSDQAAFIERVSRAGKVHIEGYIPLSDKAVEIPSIPDGSVAVFDVNPMRAARLAKLGVVFPYYSVNVIDAFLEQAYQSISASGRVMVLKRKRASKYADRTYLDVISRLSQREDVIVVDPDVSARRLIQKVDATISLPYTSTAIIGLMCDKPSIYFDPVAVLAPNGMTSHGVPVIGSFERLAAWVGDLS